MSVNFKIFLIFILILGFSFRSLASIEPGEVKIIYATQSVQVCPPSILGSGVCQYPSIQDIVLKISEIIIYIAPVVLVLLIILGGFFYLFSAFGKKNIELGHQYIKWGVIGYIILLIITLVLSFISVFLGGPLE